MQLFIGAFTNYSGFELATFILAIIATALSIAFIFLTFKKEVGNVFKVFSHIVLPVLAITLLFSLMFMRLGTFSDVISYVVAFGIAVCCELIAFGVSLIIDKRTGNN